MIVTGVALRSLGRAGWRPSAAQSRHGIRVPAGSRLPSCKVFCHRRQAEGEPALRIRDSPAIGFCIDSVKRLFAGAVGPDQVTACDKCTWDWISVAVDHAALGGTGEGLGIAGHKRNDVHAAGVLILVHVQHSGDAVVWMLDGEHE